MFVRGLKKRIPTQLKVMGDKRKDANSGDKGGRGSRTTTGRGGRGRGAELRGRGGRGYQSQTRDKLKDKGDVITLPVITMEVQQLQLKPLLQEWLNRHYPKVSSVVKRQMYVVPEVPTKEKIINRWPEIYQKHSGSMESDLTLKWASTIWIMISRITNPLKSSACLWSATDTLCRHGHAILRLCLVFHVLWL